MEGRAIARPNDHGFELRCQIIWALQWRAGQLPGQTGLSRRTEKEKMDLQWRAGQLPGQTSAVDQLVGLLAGPSMEGRAIARPNTADP